MDANKPALDWTTDVWDVEKKRISRRRQAHDIADEPSGESATVGLALSGGGIRSATFSLGLMRGLAKAQLLESFDYLSTVSGGGYAGAFFNSLFARWKPLTAESKTIEGAALAEKARAKRPYDTLRDPICRPRDSGSSPGWPLWWLRSSGRYLAPTGAGDYVYAAAMAIRNLFAIHYVLGLTLLIAAALGIAIDSTVRSVPGVSALGDLAKVAGGGFGIVASAMFLLWLVPLGLAYFATEMPKPGTAQAARPDWWKSSTWRNTCFAGSASFALMLLMWPPVARWILSTTAARYIGEILGPSWLVYSGSMTLTLVTAAIAAIVGFSLFFLGSAGEFVEEGRHMPKGTSNTGAQSPQGKMLATRVVLTKRLATALKFFLVVVAVALLLYVSRWLIVKEWWHVFAAAGTGGTVLVALVKKMASSIAVPVSAKKPVAIPFEFVALVLGFVLLAALAIGWTAFAWGTAATLSSSSVKFLDRPIASLFGLVALLLPLARITGVSFQFINLSSIQNLYSSRLVRAYLGASNPARSDGLDTRWIRISDTHPDDNLPLDRYYDSANFAPVHIINVTLNETVSPTDPLVQRDRHGRSLAMCPDFLCVDGVWSHRRREDNEPAAAPGPLRRAVAWVKNVFSWRNKSAFTAGKATHEADRPSVLPPEGLPESMALGSWIGISGAAFSTGIGRGTSIGKSLLLGIANVRLGHWWRSGDLEEREGRSKTDNVLRYLAKKFRTQAYLVAELLGRFSGRYAPYWYLSDGGHFDNTGVYELLRRRVGVILCSDNGADPSYSWDDLANLIRLSRIDFGCEFEELSTSDALESFELAHLELAPDADARGDFKDVRCLRLFRVSHEARGFSDFSLLIVVKPRLVKGAPVDVQQYARTNGGFPQETTANQFFSEEQWESYRKLGETVGERLANAILSGSAADAPQGLRKLHGLRAIAGTVRPDVQPQVSQTKRELKLNF